MEMEEVENMIIDVVGIEKETGTMSTDMNVRGTAPGVVIVINLLAMTIHIGTRNAKDRHLVLVRCSLMEEQTDMYHPKRNPKKKKASEYRSDVRFISYRY